MRKVMMQWLLLEKLMVREREYAILYITDEDIHSLDVRIVDVNGILFNEL